MKQWKYKSKFNLAASVDLGKKESFASNQLVASTSLDQIQAILPSEDDRLKNPDLLYSAFPAFVANLANANDDGIRTKEAIAIAPFFKDKQCNVEHMRSYVIGHCINHGYSKFLTNEVLKASEVADTEKPFNVTLAAVVYKVVDEYFAETLENSDNPEHYRYRGISASWELGFDEFILALGSKQFSEAEIIEDDAQIEELFQYHRAAGGTGFTPDGVPVYRIVVGEATPLGIGFTSNPAAAVQGVSVAKASAMSNEDFKKHLLEIVEKDPSFLQSFTQKKEPLAEGSEGENADEVKASKLGKNAPKDDNLIKTNKNNKKSSQSPKAIVIDNTMKICDLTQEALAEMKASDIRDMLNSELEKANTAWTDKVETEAKAKADAENALKEAKELGEKAAEDLKEVKDSLAAVKAESEKAAQIAAFNERMQSIDESYELDEKQHKAVARQIRELSDEDYAAWREDFDVLNASNVRKEEEEGKSDEEKAKEALANAKQKNDPIVPNSSDGADADAKAEYADAFTVGKGIVIHS